MVARAPLGLDNFKEKKSMALKELILGRDKFLILGQRVMKILDFCISFNFLRGYRSGYNSTSKHGVKAVKTIFTPVNEHKHYYLFKICRRF